MAPLVQAGDVWTGPLGGTFVANRDVDGCVYLSSQYSGVAGRLYVTPMFEAYMAEDAWELVERSEVRQ